MNFPGTFANGCRIGYSFSLTVEPMPRPKLPADAAPLILRLRVMLFLGAAPVAWFVASSGPALRLPATLGALLLIALLGPRVRFGFGDRMRPRWLTHAAVPAFDVVWAAVQLIPPMLVLSVPFMIAVGLRTGMRVVLGLAALAGLFGVILGRNLVRTRRLEVRIEGLAAPLDGYRIVHLSDLHVGSWTRAGTVSRWVARANGLAPDLIAISGDMLTSGTEFHHELADALGPLSARDGVFACLGNHDYYQEDALCALLEDRGIHVLRNEGRPLRDGLYVCGVEDLWRGTPDFDAALEARPDGATCVLLAHQPEHFPRAARRGIELTLSGHTHAGQVALPFFVRFSSLAHLTTQYPWGLYRDGPCALHVSAGLGTTGPMFRLGAAPEVVEIVLRRA